MSDLVLFKRFLEEKLLKKKTIYIIVSPTARTRGTIPVKGYAGATGRLDEIARTFSSIIHSDSLGIAHLLGPPAPPLEIFYDPEECRGEKGERSIMDMIRRAYKGRSTCLGSWRVPLELTINIIRKRGYSVNLLSETGEDLEGSVLSAGTAMLLGSHVDIPDDVLERVKGLIDLKVSIGPLSYQASQVVAYLEYVKEVC